MNQSIIEYNAMNLHQKATLLGQATFLVRHRAGGIIYSLYTYKDFYIELGIDAITKYIIDITAINTRERLEKYLGNISLGSKDLLRQAS